MADVRWQKVREIFESALRQKPEERKMFLREACGDDQSLMLEVESLLVSLDGADSFMETPAVANVANLFEGRKLKTSECFAHYQIIKQIGAGGMGNVYLARDKKLERHVAVKILNEEFSRHESNLHRFIQEAKSASALNHPNILVVHEVGVENGTHFIVSEFIEGKTLREILKESELQLPEILDIAIQIANALAAAHSAGLVHRDIKPENVMIRPDGYVKILDFGLAKLVVQKNRLFLGSEESTIQQNETAKGIILGTISYMSPEQARGKDVDARTDTWGLGVVLYEMLTGRQPFAGGTTSDKISDILSRDPEPLAAYVPDIPKDLERIVGKALRKNREERYQHIKDFVIDLKDCKQDLEISAKLQRSAVPSQRVELAAAKTADVPAQKTSSAEYVFNEIRQHKRSALLVAAVLLAAAVAVVYLVYSRYGAGTDANFHPRNIRSIAVLPLTNTTQDPETEYLSDGITESLINSLSKLPGIKVIARSSSFKYKGKDVDPQEAARSLGVEAILTGRVTQRGENLLIGVELMDAQEKTQMWGEQFNRKATDLLSVQAEISREIAESLRLRLTSGEQQQLAKRETTNPQAYELLLLGRFYQNKPLRIAWKKALDYYQQAIVLDPDYAIAYAELSAFYTNGLVGSGILRAEEGLSKAEAAARTALKLDENLAEAHEAMGLVNVYVWDWGTAERDYKRAIELNPNLASAHGGYGHYLSVVGRHEEAIAEAKRAKELDPLHPAANFALGVRFYMARQYDQALEAFKKGIEMYPDFATPHSFLGYTYAAKGMYAEAIIAYQQAIKMGSSNTSDLIFLGAAYAKVGERGKAQAIHKRLETTKEFVSPTEVAVLFAALDEPEKAFASLERAYAAHDYQLQYLGNPEFDSLRSDPRFADLLRRVGLPHNLVR